MKRYIVTVEYQKPFQFNFRPFTSVYEVENLEKLHLAIKKKIETHDYSIVFMDEEKINN